MAMELIETVTLTSAASSIEFTSIPQDGVDLVWVTSLRTDQAINWSDCSIRLNGSLSGMTDSRLLFGSDGTVGSATSAATLRINGANSTSSTFDSSSLYFSNYTSTNSKSVSVDNVIENNSSVNFMSIEAKSTFTAPITAISLTSPSNFVAGSTASLYKIF